MYVTCLDQAFLIHEVHTISLASFVFHIPEMRYCTMLAIQELRDSCDSDEALGSANPSEQQTELTEFCPAWLSQSPYSVTQNPAMTTLNLDHLHSGNDREFIRFPSRRSVVHSTKGIISSSQPLANEAGYKILAKGGNAADAAVAVAAALNVTGTDPLKSLSINCRTRNDRLAFGEGIEF